MKALIVDDDRVLADVVAFTLKREGFQVLQAHDGEMALRRWQEEQPDIIILDVNLPDIDGFSLCKRIREESDVPILLLTVRDEEKDIVHGFELGADDYIPKPFSPRQLVARAKAVLRRAGSKQPAAVYTFGPLSLDMSRRKVSKGSHAVVQLSWLEARLLQCLILNAGRVVTQDAIIDQVWGPRGADRDMLRQLVHRLRSKVESNPSQPEFIETVPGIGYGLTLPENPS